MSRFHVEGKLIGLLRSGETRSAPTTAVFRMLWWMVVIVRLTVSVRQEINKPPTTATR